MMRINYLLLILLVGLVCPGFTQESKIDSLKNIISLQDSDTIKVKLLFSLSDELELDTVPLWNDDPDLSEISLDKEWGFVEILRWAKKYKVDIILERSGGLSSTHISELTSLKKLWNKL